MEAIVLAGGLGTRLRSVVSDLPKPMAPVGGRPFLEYLLSRLEHNGVRRAILSVGYMHEKIREAFGSRYRNMDLFYSIEEEPLGTGGAIALALGKTAAKNLLVLNGDTYFDLMMRDIYSLHNKAGADLTLGLKPMKDFNRYGNVIVSRGSVTGFEEKKQTSDGFIYAGVCVMETDIFNRFGMTGKFSFEKDLLEQHTSELDIRSFEHDGYFIDIGIPEDYERAQSEMKAYL